MYVDPIRKSDRTSRRTTTTFISVIHCVWKWHKSIQQLGEASNIADQKLPRSTAPGDTEEPKCDVRKREGFNCSLFACHPVK